MAELNEKELEQVSGGANGTRVRINLTGTYWGDSFKGGGTHTRAIGWAGLTAEYAAPKGTAPYRIYHNGTAIGWTVRDHFDVL